MRLFRAVLTAHDYLFFIHSEYGVPLRSLTSEYIHNYALMYALNTLELTTQRIVSTTIPHYIKEDKPNLEELAKFSVYATPASRSDKAPIIGFSQESMKKASIPFPEAPVQITWNAIREGQVSTTELAKKLVYPKFGTYTKQPPLSTFQFYTIGMGPSIIRIGKKDAIARIDYEELEVFRTIRISELTDPLLIHHPVNPLDLPSGVNPRFTKMYLMKPSRLLLGVELTATNVDNKTIAVAKARDRLGNIIHIAIPNIRLYSSLASIP